MHLGNGLSPTQTVQKTKQMTVFSVAAVKQKKSLCVFAFSIGSRNSSSVIWHMCITVVQSKARRGIITTKTSRSFTHI